MIRTFEYDEFGPGMGFPSIKDSFQDERYPGQDKIVKFLRREGDTYMVSNIPKDIITGESIGFTQEFRRLGNFKWLNTLAYYVDKYNLRLRKDFEDYILNEYFGDESDTTSEVR